MKKVHSKKPKKSLEISETPKFSPILALLSVTVVAIIGVMMIKFGLAAQDASISIYVSFRDAGSVTGPVNGATVTVKSSSGSCSSSSKKTGSNGIALFTNCTSGVNFYVSSVSYGPGFWVDPNGSGIKINEPFYVIKSTGTGAIPLRNLYLTPDPRPKLTFSASPSSVIKGKTSTLKWSTTNADSCTLNAGLKIDGKTAGSLSVKPSKTTTYTMNCSGQYNFNQIGHTSKSAKVAVTAAASSPSPSPTPTPNPSTTPSSPPPPAPAIVKSKSGDTKPPSMPDDFEAQLTDTTASLTWEKATDNKAVVGYAIERSTDQAEWEYVTKDVKGTSYEDSLTEPSTYYYRLRSLDASGNESEATFAYIVLEDENTAESDTTDEQPVADQTKPGSGSNILAVIVGSILVLVALIGGAWWFLRRKLGSGANNDYVIQNSPGTQATPHESESLKDMVMEDYDPNRPNDQHKS